MFVCLNQAAEAAAGSVRVMLHAKIAVYFKHADFSVLL